jgi:CubicO group peptidase (beta-lactamase class C family)
MADIPCTTRRTALAALAGTFLAPGARSQPAWNTERIQALEAQLRAAPHVRALLMERRGASFAYYQQGTTALSRNNVASVTKSVVSLLVGIAIERGLVASVEEPLAAFFPEHAQGPGAAALQRVTLRHLLTMSSGFGRATTYDDYIDLSRRLYAPGFLAYALARPLAYEPGSRFQYDSTDTHLLALALARRLKVPLMEFAQEALFRPLGIDGAEWSAGHDGVPIGAAELRLTAPEMLRIGQMMRAGGSWQGRQVVPAAFVREATTRKIATDIPAARPPGAVGLRLPVLAVVHPRRRFAGLQRVRFRRAIHLRRACARGGRGDAHRRDFPGGGDPDRDDHSRNSAGGGALKGLLSPTFGTRGLAFFWLNGKEEARCCEVPQRPFQGFGVRAQLPAT